MSDPIHRVIVFLVDDSEDDRFFFELALKSAAAGAELVCAEDGEEAIEYLSRAGNSKNSGESPPPDYIFLDLKMPRRDGFEVLEWIAGNFPGGHFPIIVLSGSHEPADRQRACELGAVDYIVKPITIPKLRELLSKKVVSDQ
jgi:CheY-like chemotaxis protein